MKFGKEDIVKIVKIRLRNPSAEYKKGWVEYSKFPFCKNRIGKIMEVYPTQEFKYRVKFIDERLNEKIRGMSKIERYSNNYPLFAEDELENATEKDIEIDKQHEIEGNI